MPVWVGNFRYHPLDYRFLEEFPDLFVDQDIRRYHSGGILLVERKIGFYSLFSVSSGLKIPLAGELIRKIIRHVSVSYSTCCSSSEVPLLQGNRDVEGYYYTFCPYQRSFDIIICEGLKKRRIFRR